MTPELLRGLLDPHAPIRALAADSASDWPSHYDDDELDLLTPVLVWLAGVETADIDREAQLHALAEFAACGQLAADVPGRIAKIARERLSGSALEHYNYLVSLRDPRGA